jgi:hypothetical protein
MRNNVASSKLHITVVKIAFLFADHLESSQTNPNESIKPKINKAILIFECFKGKAVLIEG